MKPKTKQLRALLAEHDKMKNIYLSCYESISILRDELRASKFKLEDMVNFIYVMREISKLANDLRKEVDGVGHMFENTACVIWVAQTDGRPIRASLATGTPDCRLALKIPNRNHEPEKFEKLMKFFKIPKQVMTDKVVKLHWPGLCDYISVLAEEGKPLPPGVSPDNTYPTYSVKIRGIKNLEELTRALEQAGRKEADEILDSASDKSDEILDAACDELLTTRESKQRNNKQRKEK